jgi:hypothetical protein
VYEKLLLHCFQKIPEKKLILLAAVSLVSRKTLVQKQLAFKFNQIYQIFVKMDTMQP